MQLRALACVLVCAAACGDNVHGDEGNGGPARVITTVTPDPVVAGAELRAICTVVDGDGNPLEGFTPTFTISPTDPATVITSTTAVLTKAGHYAGQCEIPDVAGDFAQFDVVPALPARIMIGKQPDQQVYGIGAAVNITHAVADRYGNTIAMPLVVTTSTAGNGSGPITQPAVDAFAYGSEGSYHVHAQVMPPTDTDQDVSADLDLIVNQSGPAITCGAPLDASMLTLNEGASITFTGTAVDTNGTMDVEVNGTPVTVDATGAFSAPITTRFGINFIDVDATDTYGVTTTKVCTFLTAPQWIPFNGALANSISLRLTQDAIDDGARGGPINSLGDLLHTVANSSGLHDTLDGTLAATNPLRPDTCEQQVCIPFTSVCTCILSDRVDYLSSSLPGPNTDTVVLQNGGIRVTERIEDPQIRLRIRGEVSGIDYDTNGPVNFDYIQVAATFDTTLVAGVPHMSVHPGSVTVTVGSISTDFNGVDGWIIDHVIVPLAQGTLRTTVTNLVQNYITSNFNTVLDGVMSHLDISTLGTTFSVPRLDGSGTIDLGFAPAFTVLATTSTRMLFGIGTTFTTTAGNLWPTLGAPVQAGSALTDPAPMGQAAAVAAHIGILDQALHELWKANFFHATLDASQINGGDPNGTTVSIDARLPPVASFANGNVELALGDVDLAIDNGTSTIALTAGIRAHTSVALVGNTLSFTGITLDEVHLSSDVVDLTTVQQDQLQMMVTNLAQQLIDTSLNNVLPALPIPSFTIPDSLAPYGLPSGSQLGITAPGLLVTPPHFVLRGGFGIQ